MDHKALSLWFSKHQRDLPWRKARTPYEVLVSEVMLQQTQVSVVIDYFSRWMAEYPTLVNLAEAEEEKVLKSWEGLGYYSRARRLHGAAKEIVKQHQGMIPSEENKLLSIKGIGPYTAGAILSFAFRKKKAAVDGNVLRVFSRLYLIEDEITKTATVSLIREKVERDLPDNKPWETMEAIIELGALVCKKKPLCHQCPLKKECKAFLEGKEQLVPYKKQNAEIIRLSRRVFIIECQGKVLLKIPPKEKLMQGLYEFPYKDFNENLDEAEFPFELDGLSFSKKTFRYFMEKVDQSYTRYQVKLYPEVHQVEKLEILHGFVWIDKEILKTLPFSSGHKKILINL